MHRDASVQHACSVLHSAESGAFVTLPVMDFQYTKAIVAAVWTLAVLAVAYALNVTSLSGWAVIACIGLVPSLVITSVWRDWPTSMSESIQKALR